MVDMSFCTSIASLMRITFRAERTLAARINARKTRWSATFSDYLSATADKSHFEILRQSTDVQPLFDYLGYGRQES